MRFFRENVVFTSLLVSLQDVNNNWGIQKKKEYVCVYQIVFLEWKILQLVTLYLEKSLPVFSALILWLKLNQNLLTYVSFLEGLKSKVNVANHMK